MIDGPRPYSTTKDSGVPWLGEVPEHWEVQRLKRVCRLAYGDALASESRKEGEVPVYGSNGRVGFHSVPNARQPCLVIGRKGSFGRVNFSSEPVFAIDTTYYVDPRTSSADIRWLYYLLGWLRLDGVSKDSAIPGLDREDAYQRLAPVPPLSEQAAIVRFLDHADRRIRRYIRAKQKLIKLLEEQKQAIIHRAVTRGLDPAVRLKPSGVEWLADVPEQWEVARLSQFFTLQRGFDTTKNQQRPGSIPVVSSGGISSYHDCATAMGPGVLVGRKGTVGSVHFVEGDYWAHDTTLWVNDFKGSDPRFVYYLLTSLDLRRFDTGSANPTLNRNLIHPERVALPGRSEQRAIATRLELDLSRLAGVARGTQREIDLLREYRTRLIADVVTGKLDVREAAARLPDEAEEPESLDEAEVERDAEESDAGDGDGVPEESAA